MRSVNTWGAVALAGLGLVFACSSSTDPTASPVGSYSATTLSVSDGGQVTDVLAQGGSLTITLLANGTTSGRLFAPGGGDNGQDLDANLAGSWTRTGNTIHFDQAADTFVRDASWMFDGTTLRTTFTQGGTVVTAVLNKQ